MRSTPSFTAGTAPPCEWGKESWGTPMQLLARARRYGEAVHLLDEFLGEEVRDRVMERFAVLAPADSAA